MNQRRPFGLAPVLLTLALAGCTGLTPEGSEGPTGSPSDSPSQAEPTLSPSDYQAQVDSRWDAVVREFPDAERPEVELVQAIADGEEWATAVATCAQELGHDNVNAVGDVIQTGPDSAGGSDEQLAIDLYTCFAAYPSI